MTMNSPKLLMLVAATLLTAETPGRAQSPVPDTLTVERAVALGLAHHASLRAAQANIDAAKAGKTLALSPYLPAVGFTATDTHNEGSFVFNPTIQPKYQIYSSYSTGFSASQLIYDFGKTSNRVGASTDQVRSSEEDFRTMHDAVITNVRTAFFAALEAEDVLRVNKETLSQTEDHLRQANAFYAVGRRPLLDVRRAEVEVANAKLGLITAGNQVQVSRLQLENAMGEHLAPGYVLKGAVTHEPVAISLDSAKTVAMNLRPDILSARARYESLLSTARAAWSQHLPTLSATGTYTWNGFSATLYPKWTAGLTFSVPIFQGFSINAQHDQATAAAEVQAAQVTLTVENAMLDVEQTYLAIQAAAERIEASSRLVDEAEESLRLAEKQYAAGVGTSIEITDAQITRANARIAAIQAAYDYTIALTRLASAMGVME